MCKSCAPEVVALVRTSTNVKRAVRKNPGVEPTVAGSVGVVIGTEHVELDKPNSERASKCNASHMQRAEPPRLPSAVVPTSTTRLGPLIATLSTSSRHSPVVIRLRSGRSEGPTRRFRGLPRRCDTTIGQYEAARTSRRSVEALLQPEASCKLDTR